MRVDQTLLCTHCRIRLAQVDCCPVCGEHQLFSLCSEAGRRAALRELMAGEPDPERRSPFAASASILIGGIIMVFVATTAPQHFWALCATCVLAAIVWAFAAIWTDELRSRNRGSHHSARTRLLIRLLPFIAPADSYQRVRMRGHVISSDVVESPLHREACAAFRVGGFYQAEEIDDAGAQYIDVELDDGDVVRVPVDHLVVDVELPPLETVSVDGDLEDFLRERVLWPMGQDHAMLSEAVIRHGDRVVIDGWHELSPPGGSVYRDLPWDMQLYGRDDSPVVIRREE